MKRLLDDYIFDDTLRYEGHKLIYRDADGMELVVGGMMGAAVLSALLDNSDEGDARGIAIDGEAQRAEFFDRYKREVRRDNGGLFTTEVEALSNAYMELSGTDSKYVTIDADARTLNIEKGSFGQVVSTFPAGTSFGKQTYYYEGGATKLYLYSANSGINIYGIRLSYPEGPQRNNNISIPARVRAQKVLRDGQVVIQRDGELYTLTGQIL